MAFSSEEIKNLGEKYGVKPELVVRNEYDRLMSFNHWFNHLKKCGINPDYRTAIKGWAAAYDKNNTMGWWGGFENHLDAIGHPDKEFLLKIAKKWWFERE